MTEIDWLRKFYRERTVNQFTLKVLCDWLEERGDNRLEGIHKVKIPRTESNRVFWQIVCPDSKVRRYDSLRTANYRLCQEIIEYFLRTDP